MKALLFLLFFVCPCYALDLPENNTDAEEQRELLTFMKKRHDLMKQNRLEESLKRTGVFEDPKYAKKVYGGLQGIQEAIDSQHKRVADTKEFKNEEEKQAYQENLKKDATLTFENFNATPEEIAAQITAQPLEKTQEMVQNMSFMNDDYASKGDDLQDDLHKRAVSLFEKENGISFENYMELLEEQARQEAEQIIQPEKLGENVRYQASENVKIEKVNETTAIIRKNKG